MSRQHLLSLASLLGAGILGSSLIGASLAHAERPQDLKTLLENAKAEPGPEPTAPAPSEARNPAGLEKLEAKPAEQRFALKKSNSFVAPKNPSGEAAASESEPPAEAME